MRTRNASFHFLLLLLSSLAASCGPGPYNYNQAPIIFPSKVIYGPDDRHELAELEGLPPIIHQQAQAVAALVYLESLQVFDGSHYRVVGPSLAKKVNLCPSEHYAQQLSVAKCSGVLLAGKLLLTAGHCINTMNCEYLRVVFDFEQQHLGPNHFIQRSLVHRLNCQGLKKMSVGLDLALVPFDEHSDLQNRPALTLQLGEYKDPLPTGTALYMLGHGQGIPLKLSFGKILTNRPEQAFFVTDLDSFGHSSGSPVFHRDSGKLLGILVAGETDYQKTATGCLISRNCGPRDPCQGEKVLKIEQLAAFFQ